MKIGDVELPIVSNIDERKEADVDEIKSYVDSITVKHDPKVRDLIISGFLNKNLHSENLDIDEQKAQLKSIRLKNKMDNTIDFKDFKGHLLIENINIDENSDSRILKNFELECRYFPWPKYFPSDEP